MRVHFRHLGQHNTYIPGRRHQLTIVSAARKLNHTAQNRTKLPPAERPRKGGACAPQVVCLTSVANCSMRVSSASWSHSSVSLAPRLLSSASLASRCVFKRSANARCRILPCSAIWFCTENSGGDDKTRGGRARCRVRGGKVAVEKVAVIYPRQHCLSCVI